MIFSRCANGGTIGKPVRQRGLKRFIGKKRPGVGPNKSVPPEECFTQGPFLGLPRNGWMGVINTDNTVHQVDLLPTEIVAPPSRAGVDGPAESSGGGPDRIMRLKIQADHLRTALPATENSKVWMACQALA